MTERVIWTVTDGVADELGMPPLLSEARAALERLDSPPSPAYRATEEVPSD